MRSILHAISKIYKHPLSHAILVFAFGEGLLWVFDLADRIPGALYWFLGTITHGVVAPQSLQLSGGGRVTVTLLYAGAWIAIAAGVYFFSERIQDAKAQSRRLVTEHFLPQAAKLYDALFRDGSGMVISAAYREIRVRRDYSVLVTDRFTLKAEGEALAALGHHAGSDVAALGFESIKFKGRCLAGDREVLCFPAEDVPNRKRFLTFLVPPLLPGGDEIRLEYRWVWPGAAKKLKGLNAPDVHEYLMNPRQRGPINLLTFMLIIDAEGNFEIAEEYAKALSTLHLRADEDENRVRFEFENVQVGAKINLRVTRVS